MKIILVMASENFGSFFEENKNLLKEYLNAKLEIYKLQLTRISSRSAGYFIWMTISFFLLWLFIIFLGLVTGFWLSKVTGSYIKGFSLTAVLILALIILLTLFRKVLFVNPIIRKIIKYSEEEKQSNSEE